MRIDDESAKFNHNPWTRFGFRWKPERPADILTNLDTFIQEAGADYQVTKEKSNRPDGSHDGRYNLVRSSDNRIVSSRHVSEIYKPICPTDLATVARPFVEQGWGTPDAFFTMGEGTKEVLILRLDAQQIPTEAEDIDGSERLWYLGLRNIHGAGAISGDLTTIRSICENTEAASAAQWAWKVRHTGNPQVAMEEAVSAWQELKDEIRKLAERFRLFADFSVSASEAKATVEKILEIEPSALALREAPGPMFGKQVPGASTASIRKRDAILDRFSDAKTGTFGKSLMDIRNAVTNYLSHGTTEGSRQDPRKVAEQHYDIGGTRYAIELRTDEVLSGMVGAK